MIPLGKVLPTGFEITEVQKVIDSGWWAGAGLATTRLEEELAKYLQLDSGYKVCAVSSATTALQLCLLYYKIYDRLVACPSYSFVATAFAINHAGGWPHFIDVDSNNVNIDINKLNIETTRLNSISVSGAQIMAVVPVHQYGIPCDISKINSGLPIVEDAACAFGSKQNGRFIGTSGNLTCFSLHARKSLTCGEGGFIIIPPACNADWFYSMRNFGMDQAPINRHNTGQYSDPVYNHIGYNFKLSDLSAAIAIGQLRNYSGILQLRRKVADRYNELLSKINGVELLHIPDNCESNWQNYRILVDQQIRDGLRDHLRSKEIMAKNCIQPIHKQPVYEKCSALFDLSQTISVSSCGIWLPFYPGMLHSEIDLVVDAIKEYIG